MYAEHLVARPSRLLFSTLFHDRLPCRRLLCRAGSVDHSGRAGGNLPRPMLAITHSLVTPRMRAVASSILFSS